MREEKELTIQGDYLVIYELNKNLGLLSATINQYLLHTHILKNWGSEELGEHFFEQSIKEMESADSLIEHVLFLEGLLNLQDLSKLLIGESTEEALSCDLQEEQEKHEALIETTVLCKEKRDYVSRDLSEKQEDIDEGHID